ncbi:MAG TPA: hypothetical protein VJJ23_04415 [Candidatus Nanoarchaeia archaeon]|nr:hypothetical protein [Candidatus Nanoarchaeia archaeon]
MTLSEFVKDFALFVGLGLTLSSPIATALLIDNYHSHNNVRYLDKGLGRDDRRLVCKKADGLLGYTEIDLYERDGKIEVGKNSVFSDSKIYVDEDGDWYVDEIYISSGLFSMREPILLFRDRNKDFKDHKRLFEEANKVLEKELQRFKPLIEKQL